MADYDHPYKDDPLVRTVLIADEIEHSPGVKKLMRMAGQDAYDALQELVQVSPWRVFKVQRLQNRVQRFLDLERYIAQVIDAGREAEERARAEANALPAEGSQ
jgi:hypothetical protein